MDDQLPILIFSSLFPFPCPSHSHSTGPSESAVNHPDRQHQQLHPDWLRHWKQHPPVCGGRSSASHAGTRASHARWGTAKPNQHNITDSAKFKMLTVLRWSANIKFDLCYRSDEVQLRKRAAGGITDRSFAFTSSIWRASEHQHPQLPPQLRHHRGQQQHARWDEPAARLKRKDLKCCVWPQTQETLFSLPPL